MKLELTIPGGGAGPFPAAQGSFFFCDGKLSLAGSTTSGGGAYVGANNQINLLRFVLPIAITVTKIAFRTSTGVAGKHADMGIYDTAGNRIVSMGAQSIAASNAVITANVGPVTILPGTYFLAWTADDNTASVTPAYATVPIGSLYNVQEAMWTVSGTASVGGALPAGPILVAFTSTPTLLIPAVLFYGV